MFYVVQSYFLIIKNNSKIMTSRNLAFIMGSFIFIIKFYLSIDIKDANTAFKPRSGFISEWV